MCNHISKMLAKFCGQNHPLSINSVCMCSSYRSYFQTHQPSVHQWDNLQDQPNLMQNLPGKIFPHGKFLIACIPFEWLHFPNNDQFFTLTEYCQFLFPCLFLENSPKKATAEHTVMALLKESAF